MPPILVIRRIFTLFCLNYYPHQDYLKEVDQLKIFYRAADRTLQDFLETFKDKSIVIDVTNSFEELDAQLFQGLYEKYKNFRLVVNYFNKDSLDRIKAHNLPFFFSNFVASIDQLHGLLAYQPTDMYITEELGFFLNKISKILHNNNIKVRVFPNICQSCFSEIPSIKKFFIRPEDIESYSEYVDIFELVSDEQRQRIIYKIYKQQYWRGPVSEIIPTFEGDLDSRYLLSNFGAIRAKCGKRCLYAPGSCSICDQYSELAHTFAENHLIIQKVKKKD